MKRARNLAAVIVILAGSLSHAEIANPLADAARPLNEGVPEVAVTRLQQLLKQNLSDSEWRLVAEKLLEALVAANQSADALKLADDPRLQHSSTAIFWHAQLFASLNRQTEALPLYRQLAADQKSALHAESLFGAAEMLRALGQQDEALQDLTALFRDSKWNVRAQLRAAEIYLDKSDAGNAQRLLEKTQPANIADKKQRHFLRGRVEIALRHFDRAIETFNSILKQSDGATHETLTAVLFSLADTHLQQGTPEIGDDALENFIEHHPLDVDLPRIFAKLDELYRAEHKPSRSELDRWARDPAQPRRAFAQWYLARFDLRIGRRDRALDSFAALRKNHPQNSALAPAFLEFARVEVEDRRFDDALAILTDARALRPQPATLDRLNLLAAEINYRSRRFDAATADFEQLASSGSQLAPVAMFNAALGALQSGDETRFVANVERLGTKTEDQKSQTDLRLEAGLTEAGKNDPGAAALLKNFLRVFPQSDRAAEAWLALAELAFHAAPPRVDEARKDLARAAESKPAAAAQERADYLAVWLEDATPGGETKAIDLARKFVQQHDKSALLPSVRMKLGEIYFRQEDFANAETQFELLTEEDPKGALTERALFFAGEAAIGSITPQSLDRAIVLLDRVVQLNGEFKWAARNEEAVIERKLGKPQDALALYDEVLNGAAKPAEKREAMCGKGDIFFEMAATDPQSYQRAIEAYDRLVGDHDAPAHWRNQALFKKGLCLEKKSDRAGALASFYTILEEATRSERPREFFWFYKAGFNAGQLLEADSKWQAAAAIYEKLASAGGSRSSEARERLDRLRLEHFLRQE